MVYSAICGCDLRTDRPREWLLADAGPGQGENLTISAKQETNGRQNVPDRSVCTLYSVYGSLYLLCILG